MTRCCVHFDTMAVCSLTRSAVIWTRGGVYVARCCVYVDMKRCECASSLTRASFLTPYKSPNHVEMMAVCMWTPGGVLFDTIVVCMWTRGGADVYTVRCPWGHDSGVHFCTMACACAQEAVCILTRCRCARGPEAVCMWTRGGVHFDTMTVCISTRRLCARGHDDGVHADTRRCACGHGAVCMWTRGAVHLDTSRCAV